MKVLSLLQPWATLVVIGAKKIETRSWDTKYRGDILIHASKKMDKAQKDLCNTEPFKSVLQNLEELPLGALIGSVHILGTTTSDFFINANGNIPLIAGSKNNIKDWNTEMAFGDYSPGRFGWILTQPRTFTHHIPFTGGLGLSKEYDERICLACGCTDNNCRACIEKTGWPCHWVDQNLCSACS